MNKRNLTKNVSRVKESPLFEEDPFTAAIRAELAEKIEEVLKDELTELFGCESYERMKGRIGYRHGTERRTLYTSFGRADFKKPRARIRNPNGTESEWNSERLPRYQRRAKAVDDALIACYLSGTNTRRLKKALQPLLGGAPLSKSAMSRLLNRLKKSFDKWRTKRLDAKTYIYIYADAIYIRVRMYQRVAKLPVLVIVGVTPQGKKELLALDMRNSESEESWKAVLDDLVARGLVKPKLVIIDGNRGLRNAVEVVWPGVDVQRCAVHKERNILTKTPEHAHNEVKLDYNAIVRAESFEEAKAAREKFVRKWSKQVEGAVKSLEEAGAELLTFYKYPKAQWKSLRSTNVIERANKEFRRRVKTQDSLPNESTVLALLFGLYASGQIQMRRIDGCDQMPDSGADAQKIATSLINAK